MVSHNLYSGLNQVTGDKIIPSTGMPKSLGTILDQMSVEQLSCFILLLYLLTLVSYCVFGVTTRAF